ncbi:MAG: IgGFc-binding protein [Ignavibacteriae bacterium]|nr:IgGFc-binding protein [Ignavibacteriota bacterium]
MKSKLTHYCISTFLLLMCVSLGADAQPVDKDNKGRDFWLTFMPNFHRSSIPVENPSDSLSIFIVASEPTQGVIYYRNINGTVLRKDFQITDITKIYSFGTHYSGYALEGFNNSGEITPNNQGEFPARQYFHVTSEKDVSVYALDQAITTSEAFLVLPTDVLGQDYYVMSYNSDGSNGNPINGNQSTPSQFVIVATEDSTTITVTPKTATYINGITPETFTLNKGESYLVQALITSTNLKSDLTGSHVTSTKPIAVFGGQQRALVPHYEKGNLISRDCLIEQIPPVGTWGKNAFLTRYPLPIGMNPASKNGSDLYRILAAYDSTDVYINGVKQLVLNSGGLLEGSLDVAATVTSTKPIMVAHFKKSAGEPGNGNALSDPFMLIIPPKEQFQNFYRCINVQANDIEHPDKVYLEQYISVVAPNTTLSTVKLDGNPVDSTKFLPIPGSNYSYAILGGANGADGVTDGTHTIEAIEKIGIYVYGYGLANSYGYAGGSVYHVFDFNPPKITDISECYKTQGTVFDTLTGDSHVLEVKAPVDSMINTIVTIEPFSPVQPSVAFSAQLKDIYNDGSFVIFARDSVEYLTRKLIEIPGFTVGITQPKNADSIAHIKRIGPVGKKYCFPVELYNYGKFPQELNLLDFRAQNPLFTVDTTAPIILQPHEKKEITVCFSSPNEGDFIDTLVIGEKCSQRALVEFQMSAIVDRNKPAFILSEDSCKHSYQIFVTDTLPSDLGLLSTTVPQDSLVNCNVVTDTNTINSRIVHYVITVLDSYQDASYTIFARDSADNRSSRTENIPGFTLTIESVNDSTAFTYDSSVVGIVRCKPMSLYNYGNFPLTLTEAELGKNIIFSVPQSQFPLVIPPKERKEIQVCYTPVAIYLDGETDTLQFKFGCLQRSAGLLGTNTKQGSIKADTSICAIPLKISVLNTPTFAFLQQNTPNPLPSGGQTSIRFGLIDQSHTSLEVFDLLGNRKAILANGTLEAGVYEVAISNLQLTPGVYVYRLHYGNEALSKVMVISE